MKEFLKKYYLYIGIVIIAMISLLISYDFEKEPEITMNYNTNEQEVNKSYIYIDIRGSILNPGVYKVEAGTRLFQLINISGGYTEDVNDTVVNQSMLLRDEMYIYIPNIYEESTSFDMNSNTSNDIIVNINTATRSELETLPGIGPSTAQSIIDYRDEITRFTVIEDIMNVPGIGENTYNDIKDIITT